MSRSFRWLALGAVVVMAALVVPTAALADCHDGSATSIYTDCPSTANGKPKPVHKTTPPATTTQQTWTQPTYTYTTSTTPTPPPSRPTHAHLAQKEARALRQMGRTMRAAFHRLRVPAQVHSNRFTVELTASPTSVGSEFDLGSGPTILLALLLGSVLALVGTSGVRSWRNRHRA